jgi:hypothetical protein
MGRFLGGRGRIGICAKMNLGRGFGVMYVCT